MFYIRYVNVKKHVILFIYLDPCAFFVLIGIIVRFTKAAYSVNEDIGAIQLALILNSPSSFVETVQIISSNITAKGKQNSATIYVNIIYVFIC